ncbi:MAG: hypothetical protein WC498_02140 [Candidatus Saccharimonadales bacterium]
MPRLLGADVSPEYRAGALYFMDECVQKPDLSDAAYDLLTHTFNFGGKDYVTSPLEHCSEEQIRRIAGSLLHDEKDWLTATAQSLLDAGRIPEIIRDTVARVLLSAA